jgi:hypothetical protein
MPRWMQSREFRFTESFRSFLRGTLYMTSTHRRLRSSDSRACREDIRLLWLGESFPHPLFQTRYRVNCFVDLCPDQYFGAFARNREGGPARCSSLRSARRAAVYYAHLATVSQKKMMAREK